MSAITAPLYGLGAAATSNLAVFLPALMAAIAYFQYEQLDPESRPVDVPSDELLDRYDFIVVGAGSAETRAIQEKRALAGLGRTAPPDKNDPALGKEMNEPSTEKGDVFTPLGKEEAV
ncbi:unnamed protein product [Phaedon cochleariae]|uniref:Uncharacterized protein n=1 Tax=Phaedon cochleariae TaxID=80249 RepID=A0A9N9SF53_PHACE|nr:unnamed protein product [Phaedon cochleariae]